MAGTGKTTLVGKLAAEANLPLLMLAPSTVLSKWAGASERMLKKVCGRVVLEASQALRGRFVLMPAVVKSCSSELT